MEKIFSKNILVVEDDNTNRLLLKQMLKNKDISIMFAKTGAEALTFFESHPKPNIVLMDIRLPDINGIELSKIILEKHPNVSIIAQTAFATPEVEEECRKVGMKEFITKPLNAQLLERVLNRLA